MPRSACKRVCEPAIAFLRLASIVLAVLPALSCSPANATTKGLNQIVTPDIQPEGALSLSFQQQDPTIGNRCELQTELGITNNFEIAVFQGDSPADQIGNAELGLYNRGPYLLSTGFLNWTTKGTEPQPFLEAGYYKGNSELVVGAINVVDQETAAAGAIRNTHSTQALLGAAYRPAPRLQIQADYQGGSGNFSTAGFTYSITPSLSFNPAIYVSNSTPVKGYAFAVLTWTVQAFAPKNSQSAAPPTPQPSNPAAALPKPSTTPNPPG